LLVSISFTPVGARFRDRVGVWLHSDAKGGPRLLVWRDSLAMARDHLLAGTGPEMFAAEFPKYQSVALAQAYPDNYHESPHNIFLEALLSQGVAGLAIFLLICALGIRTSFQWQVSTPMTTSLCAGLVALLASQQFTGFVLPTIVLFYLTVAVLVSSSSKPIPSNGASHSLTRAVRLVAVPLGALFLVIGVQGMYLDSRWASIRTALQRHEPGAAVAAYTMVRGLYPPEAGADLWFSRALAGAAQNTADPSLRKAGWTSATEAAIRAVTASPDPSNALYNLAALTLLQGDNQKSEVTVREAVVAAPRWYKPHWLLAEILLARGNRQDAEHEILVALDLGAHNNADVQDTVTRIRQTAH
jgi:O-antigen ligase